MSRPQSNPVRYITLLSAEALLLTLAVHGLLFFVFSYEAPQPAASTRSAGSLTLLRTPPGVRGKAFCRWLEYHDPASVVRSRSASGYQSCLPRKKGFQAVSPALRGEAALVPDPVIPPVTTAAIPAAPLTGYLPRPAAAPVKERKYPFALFDSGRTVELDVLPAVLIALGKLPEAPSQIVFDTPSGPRKLHRFSVYRSSGNRNADLLALQLVLSCAEPQDRGCSVYWKKAEGGIK